MPKEDRSSWVAVEPESTGSDSVKIAPPVSAYQYFQREMAQLIRRELTAASADGSAPDLPTVSRAVSDRWRNLQPPARERYEGMAIDDRCRFARESHLRDIEIEKRKEQLRKEREVGVLAEGTRRVRRTVLPPSESVSRAPPPKKARGKRGGPAKKRYTEVDSDEDDGSSSSSSSQSESDFSGSDDGDSSSGSDSGSSDGSSDSSASRRKRERREKKLIEQNIKRRAKEAKAQQKAVQKEKKRAVKQEKVRKERYIAGRQDALRKERADQAKRRLEFLLKQSDIFSHFGGVKEDAGRLLASRSRRDAVEPTAAAGPAAGGIESSTPVIHRRTSDLGADGAGSRRDGAVAEGGQDQVEDEELDPEINANATFLTVQPSDLTNGTMRPYQLEGLNWMIRLQENGVNGILADEMGLGKTLQSISVLVYQKQFQQCNGPHLIVVPKSTLSNWMNELAKWSPTLSAIRFHGTKDEREEMIETQMKPATTNDAARTWDVCVTTYEICNSDRQILNKFAWNYLIIDEAHRLKNEQSVFSKIVRTFETKYRLLLTGTPLQNNLHELWALLNYLVPDVFANSDQFDEWFNLDIEDAEKKNNLIGQLHKILRPFMLRRLKADVEKSLPPKHETILFVGMSAMQKKLYKDLLMRDIDVLQGKGGSGSRTAVLNIVMQLRKCAGHPYLFPGVEDRTLPPLGEHLVTNCGKMVLLDKLLRKLKENGHRVLLFTQMTRILDILEDYLVMRQYKYCRIDGNTSYDLREESIDAFNAPESEKFLFLLSTRAGGLGINLQTADVVILFDSDWNPQADLQAQDRAHRIGQKKVVNVYRLVTEHSIEEKIVERAQQKLKLDAMVVQQGRLGNKDKMSRDELLAAVRFGADKVFKSKDSSITDDDIDLILNLGKQRTEELNEKLKNAEKGDMLDFKLDGGVTSVQTYEGVDYSQQSEQAQAELFGIIDLGKRERRQVANYNEAHLYRDMEQQITGARPQRERKKATKLPKCLRLPRLEEWQMFSREDLYALQEEEEKAFRSLPEEQQKLASTGLNAAQSPGEDHQHDTADGPGTENTESQPPPFADKLPPLLSEERQAEKERLLAEGFTDWSRHHYSSFVKASAKYGRTEYAKIADEVGKPRAAIEEYCRAFWSKDIGKKRISEHEYERVVQTIEKGEKKIEQIGALERGTAILISLFDNPWFELEFCHTSWKNPNYTLEEDRHLLCWSHKYGYGQWEAIRLAIRRSQTFRFNYYMRSLTTESIGRRCEQLMRAAEREVEHLERKAREEAGIFVDDDKTGAEALPPVKLPPFRVMQERKRALAEKEQEAECADLEKKVEDIENQIETIQKRLKVLDEYSKDSSNFPSSRATSTAMEVPDDLVPELVNLVARSGCASILSVATEFTSKYTGQISKKQAQVKIDEIAKKEKREEEGDTRVVWHIKPEYMNMLDVDTLRFLRKEKEKRQDAEARTRTRGRGGHRRKSVQERRNRVQDTNESGCDSDGIPSSFPDYDGAEPPRENKKAFTHFCIHTRREVKASLDPEERKDKNRVHAILKERWQSLTAEDKVVWKKWEKWDRERYAHQTDIFDKAEKRRKHTNESSSKHGHDKAEVARATTQEQTKADKTGTEPPGGVHIPKKKRFIESSPDLRHDEHGGSSVLNIPKKRRQ